MAGKMPAEKVQHEFLDKAKAYDLDGVKEMLVKHPKLVNCQPAGRWSALMQFAAAENAAAVRYLLGLGADKDARAKDGSCATDVAKGEATKALKEDPKPAGAAKREREMPEYDDAPTVKRARDDIERAAKEGKAVQQRYEKEQFERFKEAGKKNGLSGSCMTLNHGPGAPGCCSTGKHTWHLWLCHHCSTVQFWGACVNMCDWGKLGWTCVEPKCKKKGCGCAKSQDYWKKHGRDWLVEGKE
mmetsp:Transcript_23465/g.73984  ORF Transcript_23465/g.73984 Transcript_23465/m.73984 type:complete len:242 (-) Transcript_23465:27-752(-)